MSVPRFPIRKWLWMHMLDRSGRPFVLRVTIFGVGHGTAPDARGVDDRCSAELGRRCERVRNSNPQVFRVLNDRSNDKEGREYPLDRRAE